MKTKKNQRAILSLSIVLGGASLALIKPYQNYINNQETNTNARRIEIPALESLADRSYDLITDVDQKLSAQFRNQELRDATIRSIRYGQNLIGRLYEPINSPKKAEQLITDLRATYSGEIGEKLELGRVHRVKLLRPFILEEYQQIFSGKKKLHGEPNLIATLEDGIIKHASEILSGTEYIDKKNNFRRNTIPTFKKFAEERGYEVVEVD